MPEKKWYEVDWTQELCIIGIVILACIGLNNPVVTAGIGALAGVMKGKKD